jgi:hypothetical protein
MRENSVQVFLSGFEWVYLYISDDLTKHGTETLIKVVVVVLSLSVRLKDLLKFYANIRLSHMVRAPFRG